MRTVTRVVYILVVVLAHTASAQESTARSPIEYVVTIDEPHTKMIDVSMIVRGVQAESIDIALPTWRPGRYVILNPAATVQDVAANDGAGRPLEVTKRRKSVWRVDSGGESTVEFRYRVFADSLRDRTRHVDDTHAFISGESVFVYPVDRVNHPAQVTIHAPEGWAIASGLERAPDRANTLVAPDYDTLIDSPIEVGLHEVVRFEVENLPHEIVIWGEAEYDEEQLVDDFSRIIASQKRLWGRFPYRRYVFITHVGRGAGGGTEHVNSTIMQTSLNAFEGSKENNEAYKGFLGLVSHEFFHTWNVKQLRPAGLTPYDYQTENYTPLLWVAEGTTSYYDDLTLARTGILTPEKYFRKLADAINNHRRLPARHAQSVEEASFDAWIHFASRTADDVNSRVSFYSQGALASLLLDMEIRNRSDGRENLDNVLRMLWAHFPLDSGGYTTDDLREMCDALTQTDFAGFFNSYISGTEEMNLESALKTVGLDLHFEPTKRQEADDAPATSGEAAEPAEAGDVPLKADLGVRMSGNVIRSLLRGSPLQQAGLMLGDELIALDGERLSPGRLEQRIADDFAPGDTVTLTYFRRDELKEVRVTLAGTPDGAWKIKRVAEPSPLQKSQYKTWLHQSWPGEDESPHEEPETADDGQR